MVGVCKIGQAVKESEDSSCFHLFFLTEMIKVLYNCMCLGDSGVVVFFLLCYQGHRLNRNGDKYSQACGPF